MATLVSLAGTALSTNPVDGMIGTVPVAGVVAIKVTLPGLAIAATLSGQGLETAGALAGEGLAKDPVDS